MHTLKSDSASLAVGLSTLAGYIDAAGFLHLHGAFLSFMSGNSTRMVVALSGGDMPAVMIILGIISLFVIGVFVGTLMGRFARGGRRISSCLLLVTGLLALAGVLQIFHLSSSLAIACLALAMGAENATFQRESDTVVGLTYVTGTLVKMAQKLAIAVSGGDSGDWIPYFALWLGLLAGGVLGAAGFRLVGLNCIAFAIPWSAFWYGFARMRRLSIEPAAANSPLQPNI